MRAVPSLTCCDSRVWVLCSQLPHVVTPLFALQSAYDAWQYANVLALPCSMPKCSPNETAAFLQFRNETLTRMKPIITNPSFGLWMDSCIVHGQQDVHGDWNRIQVHGVTAAQAFGDWFLNRTATRLHIDSPWPSCNTNATVDLTFPTSSTTGLALKHDDQDNDEGGNGTVGAAPARGAPPTVSPLGSFAVSNASTFVYGQGLTCLAPAQGRHGINRTLCGWQIFPPSARANYSAMNLTLDAYLPATPPVPGQLRPALVLVHGGSYKGGDSTFEQGVAACRAFASAGFVAFSINYRMINDNGKVPDEWPVNCGNPCVPRDCRTPADNRSCTMKNGWCPEVLAPGHCPNASHNGDLGWMPTYAYPAVRDAKAAIRWVRAHAAEFAIDPACVTVSGDSAGAATAVALGLLGERDYKDELTVDQDPTLASTNLAESSSVQAVLSHWGCDWMARQMWLRGSGSSSSLYSASNAPLCIFHGTADKAVPFALETGRMVAGYNTTGVPFAFFPISGAGHGAWGAQHNITTCLGPACGGQGEDSSLLAARVGPNAHWEHEISFRFLVQQLKLRVVPPGQRAQSREA